MASSNDTTSPITASSPSRSALPAERAFVVQLRADADLAQSVVRGRVEHVVSGCVVLFESLEELLHGMRDAERTWTSTRSRSPSASGHPSAAEAARRKESSP